MRRSQFGDGQTMAAPKKQESGGSMTFYNWRATLGRRDVSDARKQKTLEDENAWPTRLLAEQGLDQGVVETLLGGMTWRLCAKKAVAAGRCGFGPRPERVIWQRQGWRVDPKKLERLSRDEMR